jgi:hypothetical protein
MTNEAGRIVPAGLVLGFVEPFSVGEPGRIRTSNQLIKSQMLCR